MQSILTQSVYRMLTPQGPPDLSCLSPAQITPVDISPINAALFKYLLQTFLGWIGMLTSFSDDRISPVLEDIYELIFPTLYKHSFRAGVTIFFIHISESYSHTWTGVAWMIRFLWQTNWNDKPAVINDRLVQLQNDNVFTVNQRNTLVRLYQSYNCSICPISGVIKLFLEMHSGSILSEMLN